MQIILVKQPYEVSFSGNPIPYLFSLSPYTDREESQNLRIVIGVQVEQAFSSGIFDEVKTQTFFPDADGGIVFDISSILHPYLEYFIPPLSLDQPVFATGQYKRYQLSYYLTKDNIPLTVKVVTGPQLVIKGGMPYQDWNPVDFFEQVIQGGRPWLQFETPGEKVQLLDTRYLFFLCPFDVDPAGPIPIINYEMQVPAVGGSIAINCFAFKKWEIICIPATIDKIPGLLSQLSAGDSVSSYTVNFSTSSGLSVTYTYVVDQRNLYNGHTILYRTSCGGIETFTLRGQVDMEAEYSRENITKINPPIYYANQNLLAQQQELHNEETEKYAGDTGFVSKPVMMKLRDLLLSVQKWEFVGGKLIPVVSVQKNVKFFSNKDNLVSMQLEWQRAFTNSSNTPAGLIPGGLSCPAVETFIVGQLNKTTLEIYYALRVPYDRVEITVQCVPTGVTATYLFNGNSGRVLVPAVSDPANETGLPYYKLVSARTVCDELHNSYGPNWDINIVVDNSTPVAINHTYSINKGFSTPVVLETNLLDGCYDPDDDPIQAVPELSGIHGDMGGLFVINDVGYCYYTPPSPSFTGTEICPYQIREVGGSTLASANMIVLVGNGIKTIYVKIVTTNSITSLTDTPPTKVAKTTCKTWVYFYSDAAGTVATDVTGLRLIINFNKYLQEEVRGTPLPTYVIKMTVAATGTRTLVADGEVYYRDWYYPFGSSNEVRNTSYLVQYGAGYVAI